MNILNITPDDPRLTAYALGELEPAEMVALEAAIKDDPAALAAVAQIRALGTELSSALATEPLPAVPEAQIQNEKAATPPVPDFYRSRKVVRFPYFLVAGLAAACFAVMAVHQHEDTLQGRRIAAAKAGALETDQLAQEVAKLEERSRSMYEIDLKGGNDGEPVVRMPNVVAAEQPAEPEQVAQNFSGSVIGAAQEEHAKIPAGDFTETIVLAPFETTASPGRGYAASTGSVSSQAVAGKKLDGSASPAGDFNTEAYAYSKDNDYLAVQENPLSTFSIDVDTASYSNLRRFLNAGQRPPRDAVRVEELVNYFPYRYAAPKDDKPFAASMEVASAPWNPSHRLVRIGLKGREIPLADRPPLNLVFLLDVSGSMDEPNKLPLVQESMRLLVERLKPTDRVAIAVYAGASGLALPSTPASRKQEILAAIQALTPGGSTNGALGIQLAYDIAKANFVEGGANRVVLCTDGDFNVGVTNQGDLTRLIEEKAKSGVFLTVLGFGMGNYKDSMLVTLADKGNGNYGYVDNAAEAKKLLVDQLSGTLVTIAKDVKIQVEFNPARVASYRLIGYEKRMLKKEDFNNDKIDAGEIGAGHTVTALYEVVPVSAAPETSGSVDELKYMTRSESKRLKASDPSELLTLKVRYKVPTSDVSSKLEFPLVDSGAEFAAASQDFKFAAAVASFGMILRESPHKGAVTFDSVLGWASDGVGDDSAGYRHEFIDLVKKAKGFSG